MGSVEYHRAWHEYIEIADKPGIKEITIFPKLIGDKTDEWQIHLELHPGDTMNQAKSLFKTLDMNKFKKLKENGWIIKSNLHFSFRSSNLIWTESNCSLDQYNHYWKNKISELKQIKREEFENYFNELKNDNMITSDDLEEIQSKIFEKKHPNINICPGVSFRFIWEKNTAVTLDDKTRFVKDAKRNITDCLYTW